MNRKLQATALVLMVSGAFAALGVPTGGRQPAPAAASAHPTTLTGVADPVAAPLRLSATPTGKSGRARRIRHSMAMPFFSFASRG